MDRRELADFLRRCRERLQPSDVGLVADNRRRTPGLRREEVAQLTGMSADYYMRLEQARSPQPSTQLLASLARALRLNDDERDHLYLLAGHRPPAGRQAGDHVRPGLLFLLDRLVDTPAQILNDMGDLLVQNALAQALFGGVCPTQPQSRNIVWRWFTDAEHRTVYHPEDREYYSRLHVGDLRAAAARRGDDPAVTGLVRRLRQASPEFDQPIHRRLPLDQRARTYAALSLSTVAHGLPNADCDAPSSPMPYCTAPRKNCSVFALP
ncbi:helix-turn-helix transcriptional regulator [Actinoplanes sp. NPDC023936]|uniref:helix-turn-helix transcriptional regulator n=1 Tax=Actinoplanes sp. NPDC023936 TaxID=3154910 RepID=UPI0033E10815